MKTKLTSGSPETRRRQLLSIGFSVPTPLKGTKLEHSIILTQRDIKYEFLA